MEVLSPREILIGLSSRWQRRWTSPHDQTRTVYLTSCPTTDITQPYHSFSYLAGALNHSGHAYVVRDLNIEFWHYLISPGVISELQRECIVRLGQASGDRRLLLHSFADLLEDQSRFQAAWQTLQRDHTFSDLRCYLASVKELALLPRLLTLLSRGAIYRTFSSMSPSGSEQDRINLVTFRREVEAGFGIEVLDYFYDFHADGIAALSPILVGLTIPFLSQLEHSFALGARLRRRGIDVAIGGPIAAKFYKYIDDVEKLDTLAFGARFLVTGEGETLISALADRLGQGRDLIGLDNLVDLQRPRRLERIFFESVDSLPTPDYSLWDYSLYAAPQPGALYSPTRGCYWNKCSFCDYGLSMKGPTSPWRTRSPARVVDDLREASKYARWFFFAVDVLSPAYALKLSHEMLDQRLDIRWMADFRLESSFKLEAVKVFREAGCLGAAFGMESADQEVIDLMKKGTKVDRLSRIVDAFSDAGIPVQLMGFTGFPGEDRAQAQTTLDIAAWLSRKAATVALGKFGLTPGSDVARNPTQYGIEVLYDQSGDAAVPWELTWRHRDLAQVPPEVDDLKSSLRLVRGFPYPFLGATTTLHSLLYFSARPPPSSPIPQWSYDFEPGVEFEVIPFYFTTSVPSPEAREEFLVQSSLTGRFLAIGAPMKQALEAYFRGGRWPAHRAGPDLDPSYRRLLDFLVDHSLALFLPRGAQ